MHHWHWIQSLGLVNLTGGNKSIVCFLPTKETGKASIRHVLLLKLGGGCYLWPILKGKNIWKILQDSQKNDRFLQQYVTKKDGNIFSKSVHYTYIIQNSFLDAKSNLLYSSFIRSRYLLMPKYFLKRKIVGKNEHAAYD